MDLREFLRRLEEAGQLQAIDEEVDWNLQAGAICTMSNRTGGPAIHFKKVKGYPDGYSLAGSLFAGPSNVKFLPERPWSRQALALDLAADTDYETFIATLLERCVEPIPPIRVSVGPCKENILREGDGDIYSLPIPYLHAGDGGRYGNAGVVLTRDPEAGWQYCGWHRWMVADGQSLVIALQPLLTPFLPGTLSAIHQKYKAANQPMPVAIVLGGDPAYLLAAAMFLRPGTEVTAVAGGLRREPIALVKAETNDLLVPADAEIVIEGAVSPTVSVPEGPFPQYIHRTPPTPGPLCHITAVTHRSSPIFPFIAEGDKFSDSLSIISTFVSLELTRFAKRDLGVPVRWLNCPVEAMMALCAVSMRIIQAGWPARLTRFLFAHPLAGWFDKVLILDETVEGVDWLDMVRDLTEKANPEKNWHWLQGTSSFVQAYSNSDAKLNPIATKMYINATFPSWWEQSQLPKRIAFETSFPPAIQERTVARWKELGLPGEPVVRKPAPTPSPL